MRNQIRIWKKLSQSGVGIVELLISAALLGFLALAVTKLGVDTWRFQTETVTSSEINEFSSSLGYFFKGLGCDDDENLNEFKGRVFPRDVVDPLNDPRAQLELTKYEGFGDQPPGTVIKAGSEFAGGKWKVRSLTWIHKTSIDPQIRKRKIEVPPDSGNFEDKEYEILVAQISLQSEMKKDGIDSGGDGDYIRMTPYNIEIPFVVDPDDNYTIVDCVDLDLDGQDICAVIGAEYDEDTNSCKPEENCFIATSFVNCTSDWNDPNQEAYDNIAAKGKEPCEDLVEPAIGSYYVAFNDGDKLSTLQSCPDDTSMILSGDIHRSDTVECGKKCTHTYYATGKIYLCMQCKDSEGKTHTDPSGTVTKLRPPCPRSQQWDASCNGGVRRLCS